MIDIITNPITLLCLAIIFLLVSMLFFYFKRMIGTLEKAQMDQARILQSFIANMEMNNSNTYPTIERNSISSNIPVQQNGGNNEKTEELIDVSDDETSDDESGYDDSDDDSDSDSDSDSDDDNNQNNTEVNTEVNTIATDNAIAAHEIIDLDYDIVDLTQDNITGDNDQHGTVKVIQLENHDLEELVKNNILEHSDLAEINDSDSVSDDSDSDSDDEEITNITMNSVKQIEEDNKSEPFVDIKSLNVKSLRQLAIDKSLVTEKDKLNKKELIKLLEVSNH
jgi:hypothetical protein